MTPQALTLAVLTFLSISIVLMVIYAGFAYRGAASSKREVDRTFSELDRLLQRRFEASGELMQICYGFIPRESRELRTVAESRGVWAMAVDHEEKLRSARDSHQALKNLLAAVHSDSNFQATENFSRFENDFAVIEKQIADQHEHYNSAIRRFNMRLQQIPIRWLSAVTGLTGQTLK